MSEKIIHYVLCNACSKLDLIQFNWAWSKEAIDKKICVNCGKPVTKLVYFISQDFKSVKKGYIKT
jgi:Zn ribbon nucleic-acid-binding protein